MPSVGVTVNQHTPKERTIARRYGFHVVHEAALRSHPWLRAQLPDISGMDYAALLEGSMGSSAAATPRCREAARLADGPRALGSLYVELSAQAHGAAAMTPDAAPPPWIATLWPAVLQRMAALPPDERASVALAATETAALLTRWLREKP
jgi:hypothetical protein